MVTRLCLASLALIALVAPPAGAQDQARPRASDLHNEVEGKRTILELAAEGPAVKKGDVVAEVDVTDLLQKQEARRIAGERAAARLDEARKARDAAVETLRAYIEENRPQDLAPARAQIVMARGDLEKAREAYQWAMKMFQSGDVSSAKLKQAMLAFEKAKVALMESETKLKVLEKFAGVKTIRELETRVEAASIDLASLEDNQAIQDQIETKLQRQIEKRYVRAPVDGTVVHVHEPMPVREGDTVYERQTIVRIQPAAEAKPDGPDGRPGRE